MNLNYHVSLTHEERKTITAFLGACDGHLISHVMAPLVSDEKKLEEANATLMQVYQKLMIANRDIPDIKTGVNVTNFMEQCQKADEMMAELMKQMPLGETTLPDGTRIIVER